MTSPTSLSSLARCSCCGVALSLTSSWLANCRGDVMWKEGRGATCNIRGISWEVWRDKKQDGRTNSNRDMKTSRLKKATAGNSPGERLKDGTTAFRVRNRIIAIDMDAIIQSSWMQSSQSTWMQSSQSTWMQSSNRHGCNHPNRHGCTHCN